MPSPYRLNKPRQITLKDYNEDKLKQIVANKKGWECVTDIKKVKNTYDGSTIINGEYQMRDCGFCSKPNTKEGHDGCLGTLSGIMNACCGHGQVNDAYVQFLDGSIIEKEDAINIMKILKDQKED